MSNPERPHPEQPPSPPPQPPAEPPADISRGRRLEDVISPALLEILAEASGFHFVADRALAAAGEVAYTDMRTKSIHYNPDLLIGAPERGITAWTPAQVRGFAYHEAGHHAPPVREYQDQVTKVATDPAVIPEAYRGDPEAETEFLKGMYAHFVNGLADMWDEGYIGRHPWESIAKDLRELNVGIGEIPSYLALSQPEQLIQVLLRSRHFPDQKLEGRVSPDVLAAYQRIIKARAIKRLVDATQHEDPFASDRDRAREVQDKTRVSESIVLPEYLKLVEGELKDREQKQQGGGEEGGEEGEQEGDEKGGDGGGTSSGKKGKPKKKSGKQGAAAGRQSAVPQTAEEKAKARQKALEKLGKELQKEGGKYGSQAPSKEDKDAAKDRNDAINRAARRRAGDKTIPEEKPGEEKTGEVDPLQAHRDFVRNRERQQLQEEQEGIAKAAGVEITDVRIWTEISQEYQREIQMLAEAIANVFIDDRRPAIEYLKREGDIVPGLEYETVAAIAAGDLDPDTRMKVVRQKEFLETECEFICDTSGSMSTGNKNRLSAAMAVIIVEAFRRVREMLAGQGLLEPMKEDPLRFGAVAFADRAERITTLDEPASKEKELKVVNRIMQSGGSTDERAALGGVHKEFKLRSHKVIKLMIVLTDGQGTREAIAPTIQQIEDDPEVVMLVVGLGDDDESANAIVESYLAPLRQPDRNIFGAAATDIKQMLPQVVGFLTREIAKRKRVRR